MEAGAHYGQHVGKLEKEKELGLQTGAWDRDRDPEVDSSSVKWLLLRELDALASTMPRR